MDFLVYNGKVAVALLVFYLFYRFLLKKETFHGFNRVVLVGTALLSFVLPLCIITIHKPMETGVESMALEPTLVEAQELTPMVSSSTPWWPTALAALFWAGMIFSLLRIVVSILSIVRIVRKSELVKVDDGCKIMVTDRNIAPFSWMHCIVLSRVDWEGNCTPIITHEKAHIALRHSVDVLLVDILSAFQWFNPAIWMLRSDLKDLHEYEADDAVLRSGTNVKEYQYLLIRKAVSKSGYSVANSFNHSILKNRITMMSKIKSPLSRGLRALYLLPLVCLCLTLQARTVYEPSNKGNENSGDPVTLELTVTADQKVKSGPYIFGLEGFAEHAKDLCEFFKFKGASDVSVLVRAEPDVPQSYIEELKYELRKAGLLKVTFQPLAKTADEMPNKSNGALYILRQVWGEEKVITKTEFDKLDETRIKDISVLKDAEARKKYGERGSDGVIVVTMKRPQELQEVVVVSSREQEEDVPFFLVKPETMPKFQGEDMEAFSKWMNTKLFKPKDCNHEGTMKVSFVVGCDGIVKDVKVVNSVCEELDAEVVSIINQSPKWEPATSGGKPVEQCLTMPVVFINR